MTVSNPVMHIHLSSDGSIKIWDARTTTCSATMTGHTGWVNVIHFLDDGKLISGSYDRTLKLWDLSRGGILLSYL